MMTDKQWTSFWRIVATVALALSAFATTLAGVSLTEPEEPVARGGVSAGCYRDLGGDKWICQDGGEMEFQSGSTLDIQSGATTGFDAAMDLDSTLNVDGATTLNSTLDVDGNISSGTGAVTVTDNVMIDGAADAVQLTVQGYTTQTSALLTLEQSDGTDVLTVSNAGNLDADGTLNYGADDLTPFAYDGTTQHEMYFSYASSVTQTTVTSATHKMTTAVDWGICFVSDPDADAGDPAYCTISISGTSITFQALDDDGDNAATAATKIYYLIIGR